MKRSIRSPWLASLTMVVGSFACSDGGGGTNEPVIVAQATLDSTGGTLAAPDGAVYLKVPPGALEMATNLSLEQRTPPAGAVGAESYAIRPDGVAFAVEVTVALKYDAKDLGGHNDQELSVAVYDDSKRVWQPLTSQVVDVVKHEVRGGTRMIAKGAYGKVLRTMPVSGSDGGIDFPMGGGSGIGGASGTSGGPGMGGSTTVTRKDAGTGFGGGPGAGGSISGGGGSAPLGGGPALPDAGAVMCFPEHNVTPTAPFPTCATSPVCSTYPGTFIQGCIDNPNGYDAQCCK